MQRINRDGGLSERGRCDYWTCSMRAGFPPDNLDLLGIERRAVGAEDVVEPDFRLSRSGMLPGVPGIDRVALAHHESPVVGADVLLFEERKDGFERAADRTRHVFGADQWAPILFQRLDALAG